MFYQDNGVKGMLLNRSCSSPGRVFHAQQVDPDRQPATVSNKDMLKIATWNVRTLYQKGKLANVQQEMDRLQIDILGLCEIRWTGGGKITSENTTIIYSGGDSHLRGVGFILTKDVAAALIGYWALSDRVLLIKIKGRPFNVCIIQAYAPTADSSEEDIEDFYGQLDQAKKQCKSQDILIVMGDFNAKVGKGGYEDIVGSYGLGERNERGDKLIEWCTENSQVLMNTWFQHHPRRLWTWKSPGGNVKNQIDYVTISRRHRNAVRQVKCYPGADCDSDHSLLALWMKVKCKKLKKSKVTSRYDFKLLARSNEIQENYNIKVKNKFECLQELDDLNAYWQQIRDIIADSAKEIIPRKEQKAKQKWMTAEILDLMVDRRIAKQCQDSAKYKEKDKLIRQKCIQEKEEWFNERCEEIEVLSKKNQQLMYEKVKNLLKPRKCSSNGCIKGKDGSIIIDKSEILVRWEEYIKELYDDEDRGPQLKIQRHMEGPPILQSEIKHAIKKMKRGRATGIDEIAVEMIIALEEFGIEQLTKFANKVYDAGKFPDELSKSIFIALPKVNGAIECDLHRTISLMSHVTKIILRVILLRARNKVRQEISDEQYGFMKDRGTRNAIYMMRLMAERAIEMQRDLYVCFIDFKKAFDRVKHKDLMVMLNDIKIDSKDLRVIQDLYWRQQAAIKIDKDVSKYVEIKRGVRQGCVLSPDLFLLYSEIIMREIKDIDGIKVNGENINNVRYADDTALIADSESKLQHIVDRIVSTSDRFGLSLNVKKTFCMVISKKKESPKCHLVVDDQSIKQVKQFSYLGSILTSNGRCDTEIKQRIRMAKKSFRDQMNMLANRKIKLDTRKRILKSYVWSVLLYGCEAWNVSKNMEEKLASLELWFYRRMLKVSWMDKVRNELVLERAETCRSLIKMITKRQMSFFGHICRKESLEYLVITGKFDGKRDRGRQRQGYVASLKRRLGLSWTDNAIIHSTKDRELWGTMIVNVIGHGT